MNECFIRRTGVLAVFSVLLLLQTSSALRAQQAGQDSPFSVTQSTASAKSGQPGAGTAHLKHTQEDFTSITLETSQLKAFPLTLGDVIQKENYTVEVLQVQWRDLDPIDLYVVRPKGVEKPPVIVYLYGYPSTVAAFSNESWLDRVTKGGFAAVGFVGALTDYRFRMRPMTQTYLTELGESLATTTHDVQMVLNYLGSRRDLDMNRVGLLGTGSGATVAILAAAADPRVKAIECFEPWGDWPKWLATSIEVTPPERADSMKPEFLAKVAPLDPVTWLPKLTKQQIQIQFIDTDDSLAKDAKAAIEASAPKNAQVIHFENRGQHFGAVSNGKFFDWLKAQLQPPVLTPQPQQASASVQKKENKE